MIKKFISVTSIMLLLIAAFGNLTVFAETAPPTVKSTLNSDGSTSVVINLTLEENENPQELLELYSQNLEPAGYQIEIGEQDNALLISKNYPVEEGYFLDLTLFNAGKIEFVEFKDFFSTKYGVKSTALNTENQPEGSTYFTVVLETPMNPFFSNAQIRDNNGKTNTWEIKSGSKNEIVLKFKVLNLISVISTFFAVALLLIILFFAVTNKKKNSAAENLAVQTDDAFDYFPSENEPDEGETESAQPETTREYPEEAAENSFSEEPEPAPQNDNTDTDNEIETE